MRIEKELSAFKKNILLKNYTTFRMGGKAKYFFEAKTKKDLISSIKLAKKINSPFFVLGGGSNLLISDKGFAGLVITIKDLRFKIKDNKIFLGVGVTLGQVVNIATKNNLTGLEWAVGIPGTIGGAIYGNAGAFKKSMKDIVQTVTVLESSNFKTKIFRKKKCDFKYRDSIFKKNKNLIILSAVFQLKKGNKEEIRRKMKEFLNYRREHQPLNLPSAGSVFANPEGKSAGELIEKCGLKGKRIGNVEISEKHANFIVNFGNGKAKDVRKLINLIKIKVKNKFKIDLKEEIQYLEFKN